MPVDHRAAILALRSHLLTLAVVSTAPGASLTATEDGFTRTSGSFLTEGFLRGMEVVPVGFVGTEPGIVEEVSALSMKVSGTRVEEIAWTGRSLVVGLPAKQAWENVQFDPEDGRWFVEEEYLPGGAPELFAGSNGNGEFETEPAYVVRLYGIQGYGNDALYVAEKAVRNHFPAGLTLTTNAGQSIRVRSDAAPFPGQVVAQGTGHAVVPVTIPLRAWTTNWT